MKNSRCLGGFVAVNTGLIENSYSLVAINGSNATSGGFAGRNCGKITNSFNLLKNTKMSGGFTGENSSVVSHSYFFHSMSESSKSFQKLSDNSLGQKLEEIKETKNLAALGFDLETIWEYDKEKKNISFQKEHWIYDVHNSPQYKEVSQKKQVVIKSPGDLWDLAEKINGGDTDLAEAYITLETDIDLSGKEWTPIGVKRINPFTGIFEGQGHSITNFVIRNKEISNKGFFGYLKGEVYNLTVDCCIKSNTMAGGIAAHCDGGVIGCCGAVVDITGKNGEFGGLVGKNEGSIFQSYAAGKIHLAAIPWIWALIPIGLIPLAFVVSNLVIQKPVEDIETGFAPVPFDTDAIIDPEQDENREAKPKDGNFVSFQFKEEIDVDLKTGLCAFNFKNPIDSNHNIVVQLHFTDQQAKEVMGSTGRTAEEQKALEEKPNYDPEANRTILAESGAIRPGYILENLRLVKQPNGASLPPGSYNAVVYLIFYDVKTNNRAMLDSQLPVVITVH